MGKTTFCGLQENTFSTNEWLHFMDHTDITPAIHCALGAGTECVYMCHIFECDWEDSGAVYFIIEGSKFCDLNQSSAASASTMKPRLFASGIFETITSYWSVPFFS